MFNTRIENLAYGIMKAEGWLPEKNSLTYRNHNPGALRSSPFALGVRDGFAYFLSDGVGFSALMWDLAKKCRGETVTGLGPNSILYDLVKIYTGEKDPEKLENYCKIVERFSGQSRWTQLKYFL